VFGFPWAFAAPTGDRTPLPKPTLLDHTAPRPCIFLKRCFARRDKRTII
jgi:hypothetical protein